MKICFSAYVPSNTFGTKKVKKNMKAKLITSLVCTLLIATAFVAIGTPTPSSKTTMYDNNDWWPIVGHDSRHTGVSNSSAPNTNTTLFSTQMMNHGTSTHPLNSGPTVVNGKLYLSFQGIPNSELVCADAFNGAILWNKSLGSDIDCAPTIADGRVYQFGEVLSGDFVTYLYCLNAENGSTIWTFTMPDQDVIMSSPVVSNGRVYFTGANDGVLYCVYTSNGTMAWSVGESDYGYYGWYASPAVADGKIYTVATDFFIGPSYIYCYNATDGSLVWTYYTPKGSGRAPTVMNGKVYVGAGDTMFCFNAVGNGDGTTSVIWQSTVTGTVSSSSLAYGTLYFSSDNKRVYCVNATTGVSVWNYLTVGTPTAPSLADNKIYVATYRYVGYPSHRYDMMYCLDAIGYGNGTTHAIWQTLLPDNNVEVLAQPAIAATTVWIATNDNWIHAFSSNHPPVHPAPPTGPSSGFTGVSYAFTASTTDPNNNNISYMWDWGDGTFSTWSSYLPSGSPLTEFHSFNHSGTYFVRVKARDEIGFTTTWSIGLMVVIATYQPMVVNAGGPYSGLTGEPILFTGSVTGGAPPYHWSWNFGNGQTNETQNPSYAYPTSGNYTVTLTVTDAAQQSVSDTSTATIHVPAVPKLIIDTITGGFGVRAVIKNVGNADATNVSWNISLSGGFIFYGNEITGTVSRLAPGDTATITSDLILGFGRSTITVTAMSDESASASGTASGFVILFFVLGVK